MPYDGGRFPAAAAKILATGNAVFGTFLAVGSAMRRGCERCTFKRRNGMETISRLICGSAGSMEQVPDASVDLIVTSPPYPMVAMWDDIFIAQDGRIGARLAQGEGRRAFDLMHQILDTAWDECSRVLKPGGLACINIGDATRTLNGDFQLYSNHSRILNSFLERGFAALPDILWRKQTNAPNKFMGSGMLPVGAYVTYEHEYILVLRKGKRRKFDTAGEKARRRESAFFWEERNVWFSDVWFDVKGVGQRLADPATRRRSGAFPFELAYRLICMFSIKGDVVLDPFAGTATTLVAALASARNALGVEIDDTLIPFGQAFMEAAPRIASEYNRRRLDRHEDWVRLRTENHGLPKYVNRHYGFPVMTAQEQDLLFNDITGIAIAPATDGLAVRAQYVAETRPATPSRIAAA